jgi:hypothetical protein
VPGLEGVNQPEVVVSPDRVLVEVNTWVEQEASL